MAEPERESYRSRQENELLAIQAIYDDVQDLRPAAGGWKPLNVCVRLGPQMGGSTDGSAPVHVQTTLHVICPSKYPRLVPKISLEETRGLSDTQIAQLTAKLAALAAAHKGEESLYMLAQCVQEFLHAHNRPPAGSLYDEMIHSQLVRQSDAQQRQRQPPQQQQFTAEQQTIRDMVMQRKEMFHNEPRRRDMRRSMSEASPTHPHHHAHHRSNSSSENSSENSSGDSAVVVAPGAGGHHRSPLMYPNSCADHRSSEVLYMVNAGRRIQKGCCLGHSQRGCVAYTGIDLETGQPIYLTEWTLRYAHLEHKCLFNCARTSADGRCAAGGHSVDDLCQHIERHCATLAQLRHRHIASYECVHYTKRKDGIVLYLVQDQVFGASVASLSASLGWSPEGASTVARGVLDALLYLHNQGVSHNHLSDGTVFVDSAGTVRLTDFSLVPMLVELLAPQTAGSGDAAAATATTPTTASAPRVIENDLPALGTLMETMMPGMLHADMAEFVERCKSSRTLSAADLLEHPFLRVSLADDQQLIARRQSMAGRRLAVPKTLRHHAATTAEPKVPQLSRLTTEFTTEHFLGSGAFGDVMKVRNNLDNRVYAIKRIPLEEKTTATMQRKMRREVELLSRLNHENVVRYFNSWLEQSTFEEIRMVKRAGAADGDSDDEDDSSCSDESTSQTETKASTTKSTNRSGGGRLVIPRLTIPIDGSMDDDSLWQGRNLDESSSDDDSFSMSFRNPSDDDDDDEEEDDDDDGGNGTSVTTVERSKSSVARSVHKSPRFEPQIMYIQMEFCEKSTLRDAIDGGLHREPDRCWRLLREIAEGLSHIHQQGIIHRDLKPVNIFLDLHDHVKIGDFGLATTSLMALQTVQEPAAVGTASGSELCVYGSGDKAPTTAGSATVDTPKSSLRRQQRANQQPRGDGSSLTGKVGTALYVAPELVENVASRSTYNQKVDLYSLGVIFFEMCHPKFETAMERHQVITAMRTPAIPLPEPMASDAAQVQQVRILRWLLEHSVELRPTAETLLASDLLPPAKLEDSELQEMLRHALANSQSKAYKNLVARCLSQTADKVLEMTYHLNFTLRSAEMEALKLKIAALFRRHGAEATTTPLLWPAPASEPTCSAVRLMTHSGSVVQLPHNLRVPFIKHIATTTTDRLRRYSIGRVYHEKKMFYFHPKQQFECAFDVITPQRGNLLVDAECLAMAAEIAVEYTTLSSKAITFRMNHTGLLRAAMMHSNVPEDKYHDVFDAILDHMEGRSTRFQLSAILQSLLQSKISVSTLIELMSMEFTLSGSRSSTAASVYRVLLRSRYDIAELARGAIKEMEAVVAFAQLLGVTCPVIATIGMPIHFDRCKSGGIVWQMMVNMKGGRKKATVLAEGGRYDDMLAVHQQKAIDCGINSAAHAATTKFGVGFSLALDKLIKHCENTAAATSREPNRSLDACVLLSSDTPMRETALLLRTLWRAGFRTGVFEEPTTEAAQEVARSLKVPHVLRVDDQKVVHVRSSTLGSGASKQRPVYREHSLTSRQDVVEHVQRLLAEQRGDANGGAADLSGIGGAGAAGSGSAANGLSMAAAAAVAERAGGGGGSERANDRASSSGAIGSGGGGGNKAPAASADRGTGASYQVTFLTILKQPAYQRRRLEASLLQNMTDTMMLFGRREVVHVLAVDLNAQQLRMFAGAIDWRATKSENDDELAAVKERFQRKREHMEAIYEYMLKCMKSNKKAILAVYSVIDSSFKLIL